MGKTTLTNNGDSNVQVKEGNSNIFRNLQVLKPGNSMTIQADSSATYREYVLFVLPDNKKLRPLSSDDIEELHAIEIFKDDVTGEVDWREFQKGSERKSFLRAVRGIFSPKPGIDEPGTKPPDDAGTKPPDDAGTHEAGTQTPGEAGAIPSDEAGIKTPAEAVTQTTAEADIQTTANAESSTAPP